MSVIRRIPADDMDAFIDIVVNAYPGMKVTTDEAKSKAKERIWQMDQTDTATKLYGLYRNGALLGGMRLFDFRMTMLSTEIAAGGVGMVAVDLTRKKEHVCKELIAYAVDHYRKLKAPMMTLYPFRPDFYRQMGFGYGTKINEYRFRPGELPAGPTKEHVVYATEKDYAALEDCYHRVAARTHGMIRRLKSYIRYLTRPGARIVACKRKNRIEGFIAFDFYGPRSDNWLANEIRITEFIYENREAFFELVTFLRSQADQIGLIRYITHDEFFHFVPVDARTDSGRLIQPVGHETNLQGIGIMYRVIDTDGLFRALRDHSFNGQTMRLRITIQDTFLPKHQGSYLVHFTDGRPQVKAKGEHDVEISLDVADYSSLVMGVVPFAKLHEYGRAEISDIARLDDVTRLFGVSEKPICVTDF
jgi:predicted acetyltransferase